MKHSNTTNLLKGSLIPTLLYTLILPLILLSCSNKDKTQPPCPLIGKWSVTHIETSESLRLDPEAQKIYQQELNKMLEGSYLVLTADSSYQLQLGKEHENGRWKWDPKDSLVRLQGQGSGKRYYTLQNNGQQSFKLKQELDPHKTTLVIAPYHIK